MTSQDPVTHKCSVRLSHGGILLTSVVALLVSGCAATTLENFPGTGKVLERADFLDRHPIPSLTDYQEAAQSRVKELLGQPLSLSAAMEIAMLNTPKLQRHYQRYQIWDESLVADLGEASAAEASPDATSLDWKAAQLALMKSVNTRYRFKFADEYLDVAGDFIDIGEQVRKVYVEAVAAEQLASMMQQVATATQAAAELANEQYLAGATNRREQGLHHIAHAETVKALASARLDAVRAREELNRILGLWGDDINWNVPERLPDLPAQKPVFEGLEEYALVHRFEALADRNSWEMWHTAIEVRSEVRENYAALQTTYDIAKYQQDVVLPASQAVLEETQKEYNGMLMGVYDLIDDTREQIEAGREYVETLRDYWIAEAELAQSVGGKLPE
jgi:hypothetical protein